MSGTSGILIVGYDQVFLSEAEACAERARGVPESERSAGPASSAVVAACTAAEAFLSERATYHLHNKNITPEEAEKARGGKLYHGLHRLVRCFHEDGLACHPDYPAFCAVVKLRGCIVHRSARYLETDEWPEDMKGCEGLIPAVEGEGYDWTSRVFNADVAEWAVRVARAILKEAGQHVPEPPKGRIIRESLVEGVSTRNDLDESVS